MATQTNKTYQTPQQYFMAVVKDMQRQIQELKANQLSRLVMPNLSADPTSPTPVNGQVYYNTSTNKFRGYEGGTWKNLI